MIIIIASSIALAAEDPVDEKSSKNAMLAYFDYVFTCIFAVEMFLKVSIFLLFTTDMYFINFLFLLTSFSFLN
jgi:hypothetical protein